MRILHVCIYFRNPMFMGLMKAEEKQNIEKRVCYYETRKIGLKDMHQYSYVDAVQSNIVLLPSPYLRFARLTLMAKKIKQVYENDHRFDCVHAHTLAMDGYIAYQIKKWWGIPYVLTIRSSDVEFRPYWRLKPYRKKLMEILLNSKGVIFLSTSSKEAFLNELSAEEVDRIKELISVIPNGIDDFWHQNVYENKPMDLSGNHIWKIVTVGKICRRKNQIAVCKAIEKLIQEGHKIQYNIIGNAEDKGLLNEIKKYDFVSIKEFMSKECLIKEYRNNDIFVLPSIHETFGLVYAEALTQGLPIVYSKGQGFDGQFPEGEVGYGAEPESADQIAEAMRKVMERYSEISTQCAPLSERFNWEAVSESFNKKYQSAIN